MKIFSYCLPLSLLMITGTSASASVIISFQGTSETGNIDPELNWTLDITVDNGGGGSIYEQSWVGTDITEITLTRGSYQFTGTPVSIMLVATDGLGELYVTELYSMTFSPILESGLLGFTKTDMILRNADWDLHAVSTFDALYRPWDHDGWSVSPMSNPAVPEPTSAIVWACLLTVGCLGKRSFYSLSNRSRPKSTNV